MWIKEFELPNGVILYSWEVFSVAINKRGEVMIGVEAYIRDSVDCYDKQYFHCTLEELESAVLVSECSMIEAAENIVKAKQEA